MNNLRSTVAALGKMLDEFMNDLAAIPDPVCASRPLADNVVLTVHGDTPKRPARARRLARRDAQPAERCYERGRGRSGSVRGGQGRHAPGAGLLRGSDSVRVPVTPSVVRRGRRAGPCPP